MVENQELLLKNLNAALKSKKLYPPGHPAIATPAKKSYELVLNELKLAPNVVIGLVNESLVYENNPIEGAEKLYPELIAYMVEKNVDAIIFEKGISDRELSTAIDILSGPAQLKGQELQKELHAKGITHITLKSIPVGKKNILEIYNGAVETVKNVMGEVRMGKIPKSGPVKEVVSEIIDTVFSDPNAIIGLTMIKNYDNYLYNHCVNVSVLALSLGKALNLEPAQLQSVGVGGLLHDIGKTGVSEDIIRKPGGLSSEEWEKVKQHPLLGSNIAKRMEGLDELVGTVIFEHHIKYDLTGYPQTTEKLNPLSQIITIADAYDALTTLRVYQQPHNPVEAIKVMTNFSGRHFDPTILKAFVNMLGLYPVGTMIRLSSNEIGVVTKLNNDSPDKPAIKVLFDGSGAAKAEPIEIDMAAPENKSLNIVATVNPAVTGTDLGAFFEKEAAVATPAA